MDFDFLNRSFLNAVNHVVADFRKVVEEIRPSETDLDAFCSNIRAYGHAKSVTEDFIVGGVDGSGEYPIIQQDGIFIHFMVAASACYTTQTQKQCKLSAIEQGNQIYTDFVILHDHENAIMEAYIGFLKRLTGLGIHEIVEGCDYISAFKRFSHKALRSKKINGESFLYPKAPEISSHAYQLRSLVELGMAIRLLALRPKYLLIDTSLVYFLLGESFFLPELFKRYLICKANEQGTCVVAVNKSHNIPNGDLIARKAKEDYGLLDHWYLRFPSESLGEEPLPFLQEREIPPKMGISYLFKFHRTSFPMRIDVDAAWWKKHIDGDEQKEIRFFRELDFTCHDIRAYGYPYPIHAAHRSSSLTRQERKAIRDVLLQKAQAEGILRGVSFHDPETLHSSGV